MGKEAIVYFLGSSGKKKQRLKGFAPKRDFMKL
jgi:hypothetical protein